MRKNESLKTIAFFSTVVEGLAIIALVLLPPVVQSVFVYFVMIFPAIIIILFIIMLYSKTGIFRSSPD
jgi:hypothetical protein